MALTGALAITSNIIGGVTNKGLRSQVAGLLGSDYTRGQMTYDLRRLRLKGLITRLPHSNTYVLTGDGQRVAIFYTKSTTGCSGRCSPPTNDQHRNPCDRPCASSTPTSPPTSTPPAPPPDTIATIVPPDRKTWHKRQRPSDRGSLGERGGCTAASSGRVRPRGAPPR